MKMSDLTNIEFEDLADKCYNDLLLIEDFITLNYQDFEECMYSRGIDSDYYCDYELTYCETNDKKFLDFGFKKYYGDKS